MGPLAQRITAAIVAATTVGAGGYALIQRGEGKSNTAYPDPALGWRVPTICYGHTRDVRRGDYRSDRECLSLLQEEVDAHCSYLVAYRFTQGELDAYCSFSYNVGKAAWPRSTMARRYAADDRWGACMYLLKYTYADGKHMPGLWNRRYLEYNECIQDLPVTYKPRYVHPNQH
jgi:lysozyme